MTTIDTLVCARWVIPVDDSNNALTVLNNHGVAMDNGKIIAIDKHAKLKTQFSAKETYDLPDHVLMPGLINMHTHSPMALFRGLADDLELMDWLNHHVWPAEKKWCDEQFVHEGLLLANAEMIRCGTTSFNEHYFFPETAVHTVEQTGMRAQIGLFMFDFPTGYADNAAQYCDKAVATLDKVKTNDLVSFTFAPHAPYTCNDELLLRLKDLQQQYQIPIHMHVHETQDEVKQSIENVGMRPLARLAKLGLLGPHFLNVHMTQVNDEDLQLVRTTGANVAHCPESNLKLASGYCPVQKLLDAGINVCLGTDGAASNNDLDMFGEMRTAALIGKTVAQNPTAVSASNVLRMATINGAKANGIADTTGSLTVGKAADMIAVDMHAFNTMPIFNPISHLVYSTNSTQVSDVWVGGKQLLKNQQLTTIDEDSIFAIARSWQKKLQEDLHVTA